MYNIHLHKPRLLCMSDLKAILPNTLLNELSYIEELKHLIHVVNKVIEKQFITAKEIEDINADLAKINEFIANFDYIFLNEILAKYFNFAIFVEISDAGYIIYNIPEAWSEIEFQTSGLDVVIDGLEDGHLVLSY